MAQHGTFFWNELVTPDPEAAKTFFAEILGWTSRDVEMPPGPGADTYTIFMAGDKDTAGMFRMAGPVSQGILPHWMAYIAVDDVDAACAKVVGLGGEVKVQPADIPNVGRFCVIADPTGAMVSLITPLQDA